MERDMFNGENQPKPTPVIHVERESGETMQLHWYNTTIRLFDNPIYNHVEFRPEDEEGRVVGISVTQEFLDTLHEHNFPQYSLPYVDESTYDWFVNKEVNAINYDLDHINDIT